MRRKKLAKLHVEVEERVDATIRSNERWEQAKERYLTDGDTDLLSEEAGVWIADQRFLGIEYSIARVAVEVARVISQREVSGA